MTAFDPPLAPPVESGPAHALGEGERPADGSRVAAALARLDGVHQLPPHEQPDVYQAVHTELQNALAAIDDA